MSTVTFPCIILQVVVDCKKMSDMFCHQYQVQMVNIFDMKVGKTVSEILCRYTFNLFF